MKLLQKIVKTISLVCIAFAFSSTLFAASAADKARSQRSKNLQFLVFLEVPIKNFGTDEQRKKYEELKFQYSRALGFFFEDNFIESYRVFLQLQKGLEKIYEKLSIDYVNRTEVILQGALQTLVEVDIKYNLKSDVVQRMLTNIEPPNEKPYYKEKEFHFTYDKRSMSSNMDRAYYLLGFAKDLRHKVINLEKYLEKGQPIPSSYREKRIEGYLKAIETCRKAKKNGIYVYQLINRNRHAKAEPTYKDNPTFVEKKMDPVFDTRIPEGYVIDLNDASNRIHTAEVEYKLQLKKYQRK